MTLQAVTEVWGSLQVQLQAVALQQRDYLWLAGKSLVSVKENLIWSWIATPVVEAVQREASPVLSVVVGASFHPKNCIVLTEPW